MPMYEILEFVWSLPSYKPSIEALSHDVSLSWAMLIRLKSWFEFVAMFFA